MIFAVEQACDGRCDVVQQCFVVAHDHAPFIACSSLEVVKNRQHVPAFLSAVAYWISETGCGAPGLLMGSLPKYGRVGTAGDSAGPVGK